MIDLDTPYALPIDAVARFREQGFVLLKQVLSPETLAHYGSAVTAATLEFSDETRPLAERSTYDRAFLQVHNLWRRNETVREMVFSRRLAHIAASLMEVAGVRLYHDQSLYKEPGGGLTPAHADQYYWPLALDRSITAWIPVQAVPPELGPLAFFAGSQRYENGRDLPISDESEAKITAAMEDQGFPIVEEPFDLGDISFHAGWTFHRAGPNLSSAPRSVMTIIYMDAAMRLAAPVNAMQQDDWDNWCPGAIVGEVIETRLNPLLWTNPQTASGTLASSI